MQDKTGFVKCISLGQARSQVLRPGRAKDILKGQGFCFYYIFKSISFWAQQNFGGTKILERHCPPWLRACIG